MPNAKHDRQMVLLCCNEAKDPPGMERNIKKKERESEREREETKQKLYDYTQNEGQKCDMTRVYTVRVRSFLFSFTIR